MNISSRSLEISLNEETGAIEKIVNLKTGTPFVSSNLEGYLFRLIQPRGTWTSHPLENRYCRPEIVEQSPECIELQWKNIESDLGPSNVHCSLKITVEDSEEIYLQLKVINESAYIITEVHGPMMSGWLIDPDSVNELFTIGGSCQFPANIFPLQTGTTYAQIHQKLNQAYPLEAYAPWLDLSGDHGGLSYILYMEEPRNGRFFEYNAAGYKEGVRLSFGWSSPAYILPGKTWKSPLVGISAHDGDWHLTADRFRGWMDTWFSPPPGKRSLREMIGFQNVFFRGFDGWPIRDLDQLNACAEIGKEYGVDHLCVWDEPGQGLYERMDSRELLSYSDQEKKTLQEELKSAHTNGSTVSALVNTRLVPMMSDLAKKMSEDILRLEDKSPCIENHGISHYDFGGWCRRKGPNCYVMSPFSENYEKYVIEFTENYLDLGYTSMFFDQPFVDTADHAHIDAGKMPEQTYQALISIVSGVRQRLFENNEDSYLIGEFCEAYMSQHIDLWMSWYTSITPARLAAYSFPQTLHSWVVDNDIGQASRAFAMGMVLCLCTHGNEKTLADVPEFADHIRKLADLRKYCADRTVHARFADNQGLTIIENIGGCEAYAYESDHGPAVIVVAPEADGKMKLKCTLRGDDRNSSTEGYIIDLNLTITPSKGNVCSFELSAGEVCIWIL